MRKMALMTLLLALGTACPKVERQVYTFDLKSGTGTLRFENIVTDAPDTPNKDFMEIVDKVLEGTKVEEDHPGWRVGKKELLAADAQSGKRLDGKVQFAFDDAEAAGIYKHDKKSPYIWCTNREAEEDQVIVATNGKKIAALPGCVAWDRKATELTVTLRTATMMGNEESLVGPYEKWAAGEKLEIEESSGFGGMDLGVDMGEAFAGGMAAGMADAMAGDAVVTIGDPVPSSKDAAKAANEALGPMLRSALKMCAAGAAAAGARFEETVRVAVQPDGSATVEIDPKNLDEKSTLAERSKCYAGTVGDMALPRRDAAWSFDVSVSVADGSEQSGDP